MTKHAAERYALASAGVVIVVLTAGGFWLSYAHLADVAGAHGLDSSPARRWAWPATLDAFIVAGELLMLRAGLRRVTDGWAIALTATGSIGSIALNVAGVSGTGNTRAVPLLDYVVAGVPPTAALLAFGVLMRQIHQLVGHPGRESGQPSESAVTVLARLPEPPAAASGESPEPPHRVPEGRSRGGRPPGATLEELVQIGRTAATENGKLTRAILREAVAERGLTIGSARQSEVMNILRAERETTADTEPASG
ncbi:MULTISPECIES: DUF2637 domain-containing protein [Streptomyces]|uniref:DUF2637 domain-containing protein n=1 Tax=Streptomyces TaxID=1883 RepID=UPI0013B49D36|nr:MULTISPECIES: DUF2637 domain-containing protein [Streptomyces]MDI6411128.1 DUF2637 domain-containing protein [Streptomyces albus]QID37490.1 DUF2637 domain-containing protein [Streptomyces albus]